MMAAALARETGTQTCPLGFNVERISSIICCNLQLFVTALTDMGFVSLAKVEATLAFLAAVRSWRFSCLVNLFSMARLSILAAILSKTLMMGALSLEMALTAAPIEPISSRGSTTGK